MSVTNIDELFAKTIVGDYDADDPWAAVRALRQIGSREVFEHATEWCRSDDPLKRARGADVLACFGKNHHNNFLEESYAAVSKLLEQETAIRPLASAIFTLGHLYDARAIPLITRFAMHPDAEVRFAVACALGDSRNHERSARVLTALSDDVDEDVRDWATFGLQSNLDSPHIREALVRRLDDSFEDARQEAMVGLAMRRDIRVLPPLLSELEKPVVSYCIREAAYLMLGFDGEREGWNPEDYANALRERFRTAQQEPR